jgi:LacI family transcriptional regulator
MGFLHLFAEMFPMIEVVGLREGHDDEAKSYRQAKTLLGRHPDLAGIYNIGGGAAGVARALRDARREAETVLIGHGLTPDTRALLIDGTMDAVITQNQRAILMDCATIFDNLRAGRDVASGVGRSVGEIILRENLP